MTGDLLFYAYNSGEYYVSTSYSSAIDGDTYGLRMGKDFVSALKALAPMKGDITNESRTEHGTRFKTIPYFGERSVTLIISIHGATKAAHDTNKAQLMNILSKGHFAISVPRRGTGIVFLNYQSCQSYAETRSGLSSKIAIKCVEYNPTIRNFTNLVNT